MKKYPMVKQIGERDCGAACLAMIIRYYQGDYSLDELRDLTLTTRNGTNAYNLVEAATNIGFEANCYKCSIDDMQKSNLILPCIANVLVDGKYKHFVVIYEIDFANKTIIIADPAHKIKKITIAEFKNIFNNYVIMLFPIKPIPVVTNSKINYNYFLNILKKEKKYLQKILVLSFFITVFAVISSFYIEFLIKNISSFNSYNNLLFIFLIFSMVYLLKSFFEYIRSKALIMIQQKLDAILTMDTYNNILSLPYHYYRTRTTGDIISRINDLSNVKDLITKSILIIIVDMPLTIFALIFMFLISKILFLFSLIIVGIYYLIIKIFKRVFETYILYLKKEKAEITSSMVESISGFETIKGLKIKAYIFNKFKSMYDNYLSLAVKYQKSYLKEVMFKNITSDLGFVIITFIGSYLVISNKLSLGSLFTFNALIIYFLEPLKSILSMDTDIKEARCSYKRVLELDTRTKEEEIVNKHVKGKIEIKDLSYSYDHQNDILKHVNLKIDSGEKVMVLGPSGSGKSTLFKILLKYYQVSKGKVLIDDTDINDIYNSSSIKYINQTETIFTDTLYNNLTLGNDISKDYLNEIINICYLDTIINKDPLGLNQLIEENGFNLSGGEKQRIVLARTLLLGFDVLIIDEGLNQIDISLERKILTNLMDKYPDKTIINISHRLNNKDLYNKVITLNQGQVQYV